MSFSLLVARTLAWTIVDKVVKFSTTLTAQCAGLPRLNLGFWLKFLRFIQASKVEAGFSKRFSNISPFRPPDVHTNLFELCWEICLNLRGQIRLKLWKARRRKAGSRHRGWAGHWSYRIEPFQTIRYQSWQCQWHWRRQVQDLTQTQRHWPWPIEPFQTI